MNKKSVLDVDVAEKLVLVRVDFNVPMENGAVIDDSRITAALPTIHHLLDQRARVVLCSHLGRPKGPDPALSLAPVAWRLGEMLHLPVATVGDCVGPEVDASIAELGPGGVLMLENLRYHPEEEGNDPAFARALAGATDLYINDAFGTAHRAHASTEGVTHHLPAVAGFLMERELEFLGMAVTDPERPVAAIVGGAKVSDKVKILEHMVEVVESVLIGGGMSATFFHAKGYEVGASLLEADMADVASTLEERAKARGTSLLLPVDVVIAERFEANAPSRTVAAAAISPGWTIVDIGPQTVALFRSELKKCRTVIWNGPMGVFEMPRFSAGTRGVADTVAGLDATTIVGGGSTAQAVYELGLADRMSHVSTGGGASLELMEGKVLPGVAALMDR